MRRFIGNSSVLNQIQCRVWPIPAQEIVIQKNETLGYSIYSSAMISAYIYIHSSCFNYSYLQSQRLVAFGWKNCFRWIYVYMYIRNLESLNSNQSLSQLFRALSCHITIIAVNSSAIYIIIYIYIRILIYIYILPKLYKYTCKKKEYTKNRIRSLILHQSLYSLTSEAARFHCQNWTRLMVWIPSMVNLGMVWLRFMTWF